MSRIRSRDTKPEILIRRALFARGYRYRLHDRKRPGRPDIVFPGRRALILIHGCFWHAHGCHLSATPTTRREFWENKLRESRAGAHTETPIPDEIVSQPLSRARSRRRDRGWLAHWRAGVRAVSCGRGI
ncbi:very short patch repair endonuclease [Thiocystis violacea]|uniref:very short patch repair endonuclease n=1 Tax=Thiocystis violacea TaxID=13725 RepID=UPI003B8354B1|nr:hypothetical protein [Thiocystis violacea]